MIDRPSRIYYMKRFGNLSTDVIGEVVDDMLKYPDHRMDVLEYLSLLDIITIDIVKTVVGEVNRFNEPPSTFKAILNVTISNEPRWLVKNSSGDTIYDCAVAEYDFRKDYYLSLRQMGERAYNQLGIIKSINKLKNQYTTDDGEVYTITKVKPLGSLIGYGAFDGRYN
jgi:hypothetical protein